MVWVHRKKMTHPKTPFLPYLHANRKKRSKEGYRFNAIPLLNTKNESMRN